MGNPELDSNSSNEALTPEEMFCRMPLIRFEDWGLYDTPEGYVWNKGGYPK
jgi:hypothetical protein